jgi:hypothetical protein
MSGETPRVARSPLSPHPRVLLSALGDGEFSVDLHCAGCQKYHFAGTVVVETAGSCHRADFRPSGAAAFVGTHAHNLSDDYPDDSTHIATLAARNGPEHADAYYRPTRSVHPSDLGI